jgi:ABC-type lipoprotein release transport system permease subunit
MLLLTIVSALAGLIPAYRASNQQLFPFDRD